MNFPNKLKILFAVSILAGCEAKSEPEVKKLVKKAKVTERLAREAKEGHLPFLERSGNTVLNTPVRKAPQKKLVQNKYNTFCFRPSALAEPWYVVDTELHERRKYHFYGNYDPNPEKGGYANLPDLLIVADSKKIDIPFYEIELSKPVEYEFVSPFQENTYVWITSIGPHFDKDEYFKRISKYNLRTQRSESQFSLIYSEIDYNFIPYNNLQLVSYLSELNHPNTNFIALNESLTVVVNSAKIIDAEAPTSYTSSRRPTASWYYTPTIRGAFLHKSGKVVVNFQASELALPHTPRLLHTVDNAVSSLLSDCP